MSWRASDHGDGPEPLPPEELLRFREELVAPPRPAIRAEHVAFAAAEARRFRAAASAQAIARRGARVIAGVAATIVVTTSLAGAQILPEPARAIIPAVADRLSPDREEPADDAERDEETTTTEGVTPTEQDDGRHPATTAPATSGVLQTSPGPADATDAKDTPTTLSDAPTTSVAPTSTSSTSSSTTTTEPDPTTTTTEPGSTTTTTEPGSTTTTTEAGSTTTTVLKNGKTPPAYGRADPDDGAGGGS